MIKTIASSTLLTLVFVLLTGCTTPPSRLLDEYTGEDAGYIVASVAIRHKKSYNTAEIGIRSVSSSLRGGMRYIESNFLTPASDRQEDFNEKCEKGAVGIMRVKPGRYEVHSLSNRNGSVSIVSGRALSIVIDVQPRETVYLGALTAILDFGLISPKVDEFYFNVTDQQARDLPIAMQKEPGIQATKIKSNILKPNDSTGTMLRFDNNPECLAK